jgi:hypothetical protein
MEGKDEMSNLEELVNRYLAVWQDPDPQARCAAIAELFTEDVAHYSGDRAVHGREEMAIRVTDSYRAWVEPGAYVFRSAVNADGHHGAVRFNWELVAVECGDVAGVGFEFVLLAKDGRIRADYQFIDSVPPRPGG